MARTRKIDSGAELPNDEPALADLKRRLTDIKADRLVELLLHLASDGRDLHDRIETLALSRSEGSKAKRSLADRLEQLKNADDYYTWRDARRYVGQVDRWLDDVEHAFIPDDPRSACDLLDRFLRADQEIIESVDDSDGAVGDAFRRACELWHSAAGLDPGDDDWVSRVYSLYGKNDYGLRDSLLDHAGPHLPDSALRSLVGLFHRDVERAAKNGDTYAQGAAMTAIGQIAGTLRDAALYEDSIRMRSPEPNCLQAMSIAWRYIEFGPVETAIEWLQKYVDEDRVRHDRLKLIAKAYERLGNREELAAARQQIFENSLDRGAFDDFLDALPESKHEEARSAAVAHAEQCANSIVGARLLVHLGETSRAAELVIHNPKDLRAAFYGTLLDLASELQEAGELLAEVACYRVLVLQILESGRSKAYHHAVDYIIHLETMDQVISDYGSHPSHADFIEELKAAHGRKYSFWQRQDAR